METEDLQKAVAAFLICFGQGLPPQLKSSIRQRCEVLAEQIESGGEPTVGKLLRGLADAFDTHPPPSH